MLASLTGSSQQNAQRETIRPSYRRYLRISGSDGELRNPQGRFVEEDLYGREGSGRVGRSDPRRRGV